MLFSIIIPVYNNDSNLLRKAVDSVRKQTFQDCEIILVNDGATDSSIILCMEELSEMPQVEYIVAPKNQGISEARQLGIHSAKGEWICFLDCDDSYDPEYLETFSEEIKRDSTLDMITCGYNVVDENGHMISKYPQDFKHDSVYLSYWTSAIWNRAYRREFIIQNNICFPNRCLTEDMTFILQISTHTNKISFLPVYTYNNFCNRSSTSRGKKFTQLSITQMPLDEIERYLLAYQTHIWEKEINHCSVVGLVCDHITVLCCLLSRDVADKKKVKEIIARGSSIIRTIPDYSHYVKMWNKEKSSADRKMKTIEKLIAYASDLKLDKLFMYHINRLLGRLL